MFLGIEIGGTKLQLVAGQPGHIVHRHRASVDRVQGGPGICAQITRAVDELKKSHGPFAAVGVGFGGPIDPRTGNVCTSHQIQGWTNFPLKQWMQGQVGAPAAVDNDANAAALGEAIRGAGVGLNPVFFCTLGSGVGGGLFAHGRVYHGLPPGEMEFGHLVLDRQGTTVESRCSGWAIDARIAAMAAAEPASLLAPSTSGMTAGQARMLGPALAADDPAARKILGELAEDLSLALSHVVHLLHPQVLILGGGLSLIGEPLRAAVADAMGGRVMKAFLPAPLVALPGLGEDSVPLGALELAVGAMTSRADESDFSGPPSPVFSGEG